MSKTYIGAFVFFLTLGLPALGVHVVDSGTLTDTITHLVGVAAFLFTLYGRYKAGGISAFGFRKG